ncbi:MAG TPA: orotidine-5'-phosphate decarboxylase [Candidatus Limnocylindria bacterium]|nr:orotidine-5'-phosphate decarboxylase [Candidatus Limnocylindria bacterium]
MTTPLDRLRARVERLGAPLCVGIDPHPDRLPEGLSADIAGIERFARGVVAATAEHVAAVKINVAFFEAFGSAGWAALERVRASVPTDVVTIIDAKRGDIGTTADRYAEGLFGHLDADAVTLSPYLGEDAIDPFLAHPHRLVYVLARTSNPSAPVLQERLVDGEPLHLAVARWVAGRWADGRVGLVVGATAPAELRAIREAVPGPGFLVPGVGAQGGDLDASVGAAAGTWAPGVVSVSRAIAEASRGPDWAEAAAGAGRALADRMREAVLHSNASAAQAAGHGGQ